MCGEWEQLFCWDGLCPAFFLFTCLILDGSHHLWAMMEHMSYILRYLVRCWGQQAKHHRYFTAWQPEEASSLDIYNIWFWSCGPGKIYSYQSWVLSSFSIFLIILPSSALWLSHKRSKGTYSRGLRVQVKGHPGWDAHKLTVHGMHTNFILFSCFFTKVCISDVHYLVPMAQKPLHLCNDPWYEEKFV